MTRATIFKREDGTFLFRTERGDIKNLREIGLEPVGEIDLYDADVERLNELFYYIHMACKKFDDELSPNMKAYAIPKIAALIKDDLSPSLWLEFKKGAGII